MQLTLLSLILGSAAAFGGHLIAPESKVSTRLYSSSNIEYQSDCGRGEQHLSASLQEGNVVVYQGGTWLVDGVEVGDGSDPYFRYALIETMQLVWTHNCEHGVVRGLQVECCDDAVKVVEPMEEVEFGPEQLIAKIPVVWDESTDSGKLQTSISNGMWVPME